MLAKLSKRCLGGRCLHKYQRINTYFSKADAADQPLNQHVNHSLASSTLQEKLQNGHPVRGMHSTFYGDTSHVEMVALLGYDFLWAEAEHSSASPESIEKMIIAADSRGLPTIVRIGYGYQNIIGHIQKYLTSGAVGIILPQCESAEDKWQCQ